MKIKKCNQADNQLNNNNNNTTLATGTSRILVSMARSEQGYEPDSNFEDGNA